MSEEIKTESVQVTPKADEAITNAVSAIVNTEAEKPVETKANADSVTETKQPEVKSVVPEKYDLKLAEGSLLSAADQAKIETFAKAQGLTNDQAQALLNNENASRASFIESQKEQLKKQSEAWIGEIQNDKELGGESFKETAHLAEQVIKKFASEAFRKQLNDTGLGNYPELVRVFARIGKNMKSDELVIPSAQSAGTGKSMEDVLYGSKG